MLNSSTQDEGCQRKTDCQDLFSIILTPVGISCLLSSQVSVRLLDKFYLELTLRHVSQRTLTVLRTWCNKHVVLSLTGPDETRGDPDVARVLFVLINEL